MLSLAFVTAATGTIVINTTATAVRTLQACMDAPAYVPVNGYTCASWAGYDCTMAAGYGCSSHGSTRLTVCVVAAR